MSMGFVKSAYIKENFGGNKMFKKLKDKKGFTLVELIVVLVILAILAALLIPALTGYIDKANHDKVTAECRQVTMAAQAVVSEYYGQGKKLSEDDVNTAALAEVKKLAEAPDTWQYDIIVKDNVVSTVRFFDGSNGVTYTKTADGGKYDEFVTATNVNGTGATLTTYVAPQP